MMTCRCRFIGCSQGPTPVGDVGGGEALCVWRQGGCGKSLYFVLKFAVILRLLLKKCLFEHFFKKVNERLREARSQRGVGCCGSGPMCGKEQAYGAERDPARSPKRAICENVDVQAVSAGPCACPLLPRPGSGHLRSPQVTGKHILCCRSVGDLT